MCTLHEDVFTFMTISRWILLRMRNVSDKSFRVNQNTPFMFHEFFPKNVEKYGGDREGPQTTIWWRASCWISKATLAQAHGRARAATTPPPHTHTHAHTRVRKHIRNYVTPIVFPRQQWFRESASLLRYTYRAAVVKYVKVNFHSFHPVCVCIN